MPEDTSQIGDRLKAEREEAGLTQEEAARILRVSANTVARWERGERTPSEASVQMLLAAYRERVSGGLAIPNVSRGTSDQWEPNPAFRKVVPARVYDAAIGYCRRLAAAGLSVAAVEEAERILIDPNYAKLNKQKKRPLTEDEQLQNLEGMWELLSDALSWKGVRP